VEAQPFLTFLILEDQPGLPNLDGVAVAQIVL